MSAKKASAPRAKAGEKPAEVKVAAAKGRPMLSWVGKRPLRWVTAFPAQHVETFDPTGDAATRSGEEWADWPAGYPLGGLLFHGDNKEVLAHLLANGFRGKVDLIYIDPPFDSGADYVRRVTLRGPKGAAKLDGEGYTLGEQIQYTDIWANDTYLQFMYERLLLLREALTPTGTIYLHCDARRVHQLRMLLDEVFGAERFSNQIAWRRTSSHGGAERYGAVTDHLLMYSSPNSTWNQQFQQMTQGHIERHYRHTDDRGVYALGELTAPGTRRGPTGSPWNGFDVTAIGRHWSNLPEELDRLDNEGLIYWPTKTGAWPRLKRYLEGNRGRPATDFWDDIDAINMVGRERLDYPTQKPEELVRRVIESSSRPGSVVLDCFVGSGTSAAVAQKLGRRWIGCDVNKGAIQTTTKRIQDMIQEQIASGERLDDGEGPPSPAQLAFTTWRVNDYDLQIQHNEAVNLACEHLGVERTRTDRFFDGTLGKSLVKIVPFSHPLSPTDLEEIRTELEARPDEDREVRVVCLGMELAAQAWIEDWNRLRRGRNAVNRIEAIELRTDERYGQFIAHEPASAEVRVERAGDTIRVEIDEFVSSSIVARLAQQTGVVQPRIEDWRAMVDSVMIDSSYDGEVFDITLSDVPERKTDLVAGTYELPAPKGKTTVAVKITDMLGEEVLHVATV